MTKVAIYCRVSQDSQTIENQLQELQAVAQRQGWEVVATFTDEGISGATGRDKRPGFDKLLTGVARRDFDMIAAWSVDRLGRSLSHLIAFLGDIQTEGVDLYLHQQGLDTSTSAGRAMFGMLGVFAELERSLIRERIMACETTLEKMGDPRHFRSVLWPQHFQVRGLQRHHARSGDGDRIEGEQLRVHGPKALDGSNSR